MPVVQERITEITEMDESKAAAFLGEESMHSPMIRDHRSSTITQGFRSWFAVQAVRPQRQGDITAEEKKKKKKENMRERGMGRENGGALKA